MLRPSIFNNDFVDDMFNDMFSFPARTFKKMETPMMRTDVREVGENYQFEVDLPGYKKDELQIELKEGYLTLSANKNSEVNEKDEQDRYVRRERYTGTCQRTFYIGKHVKQEDVHAAFENGVLTLTVPKEAKKVEPEKQFITIEG